jgi:serine/threonine protein kinase
MGEVSRARDTRLGRTETTKILKANFDPRFEREARTIASLNHPHPDGRNNLVVAK